MKLVLVYYFLINCIAFISFGADKRKSIKHQYRIPEATLMAMAALGGGLGAGLGMILFHHKTRKLKFQILVPFWLLLHLVCWGFIVAKWFFSHALLL